MNTPPPRDELLRRLRGARTDLSRFGVRRIALFGSCARGEEVEGSDIDLLVDFDVDPGMFELADLKLYLEGLLQARVDLATPAMLADSLRSDVDADSIDV